MPGSKITLGVCQLKPASVLRASIAGPLLSGVRRSHTA